MKNINKIELWEKLSKSQKRFLKDFYDVQEISGLYMLKILELYNIK